MKTEIWVSYNYGAYAFIFRKKFELPFTPFIGLYINDKVGEHENQIELLNHSYCTTTFYYEIGSDELITDIRNVWKRPVDEEYMDDLLKIFKNTQWERTDTTDIKNLKELMKRDQR